MLYYNIYEELIIGIFNNQIQSDTLVVKSEDTLIYDRQYGEYLQKFSSFLVFIGEIKQGVIKAF